MAFFKNAAEPVINGGNFINTAQGDTHLHFGNPDARLIRALDFLHQNVAAGAFHDAAERGDSPKCHPHTRVAVLSAIQEWVRDSEVRRKFIIWLYGPAGSGKTAIAQTIAEVFAKEQLAASFFFSRTGIGRSNTSRFIASISYQLSISMPALRGHIAAAVEHDPLVFTRTLLSQMEALIIKPLNAAAAASAADLTQAGVAHPRLVIIDGLDEAHDPKTQRELLQALATCIQQLRIPLIFIVTSRPETIIRQTFSIEPLQSLMYGLALDENYKPDNDIRIFLSAEFSKIRELHPSGNALPVEWPSQEDVDYLTRKASGQFIYASTVMKYIKTPQRNPKKQLKVIRDMADPGKDTPFAQLDALYAHILSSAEDLTRVLDILTLILFKISPDIDEYLSVDFIETLLEYDSGDVAAALTDMHALIRVPSYSENNTNQLSIYHASLHDFFMDKSRSKDFFLNLRIRHMDLARCFLKYVTTGLEERSAQNLRFGGVFQEFLYHYQKVCNLEELVTDLKEFSLTSLLSSISIHLFYFLDWNYFFNCLRRKCTGTNTALYQRLQAEFDNWIRKRYDQYPVFFRRFFSTTLATMESPKIATSHIAYLPDIFNILTYTLSPSDATCLRKLDRELFLFGSRPHVRFELCVDHSILHNFFTDPSRAGVYFSNKVDFGNLAEQIVKVLYQRGENHPQTLVKHRWDDSSNSDSGETLKIYHTNLEFFPKILAASPEDHNLAKLLWKLVIKYQNDKEDPIRKGRNTIAKSALKYMKRCGIFFPEHKHRAGCSICANFTPDFSTPSVKPKEDSAHYTTSTPDEHSRLRSKISPTLLQSIPPKTLPIPTNIVPSSFSSIPSPPTLPSSSATRACAAEVPPSANHHSNPRSPTSFSPGSRSISGGPRPTLADPSTSNSGSYRASTSLSVTSRPWPSSMTPSNTSLSPRGPPTATVAQTSRPKERHKQLASDTVPLQQKLTRGNAPKKPWK